MSAFISFRYSIVLAASLVLATTVRAEGPQPAAPEIRIGGSGSALATLQLLGEAFKQTHPQARFVIVPSLGSGGGLKALRAGAIDLAVIGRPLKDRERGPDVVAEEYARSPVVFATSTAVPVSAITTPELISIYAGERKSWPDGRPLRLVLRPDAESDTDIIKSLSPGMRDAVSAADERPGMIMALTDKANADSLETIPSAVGVITLAQIISEKRRLQPLALDGVSPSPATLADGKYRYYKTFLTVTGPSTPPSARKFAEFVRSSAVREILEKNGHWVAPSK